MPAFLAPALISIGVGAEIAPTVASLIFAGLSIALSIIFAPDVPKPDKGRQPFKQAVPPRIRIIGEMRTAGATMLFHAVKGRAHVVLALCEGPAENITKFYLHEDIITLVDGGTHNGYAEFGDDTGIYGEHRVFIEYNLGLPTETAFPDAVSDIDDPSVWSVDHRLDGIVALHMKARDAGSDEQGKRFPFGLPIPAAVVRATKVFDPREITGSPAQDWEDPTTWSYAGNDNPILQAVWFLTASIEEGGMGLDMEETFSTVWDDVAVQAEICDDPIANKGGGTLPRYVSNVLYHFSDAPSEILAAILGTCDGFCAERGDGAFELKAGLWDDDDFAITIEDKHIISLDVQRFKPDEDEVTGVIVKFTSVDHEYVTIDAPVWPRDAYQGGEDHRVRSIEVTYCTAWRQAQRLSKRVATYEMAPVTGTAVLNMYGILLLDRRGCTINCSDDPALMPSDDSPGQTRKLRLTRVEPNLLNGTVEIDFQLFDPEVADAWDAGTEEGMMQPAITPVTGTALSTPTAVTANPYQIGTIINAEISFDPGEESGSRISYRTEWRVKDAGGGVPGPSHRNEFHPNSNESESDVEHIDDDLWVVTLTNLPVGELEVRIMGFRNSFSPWSDWVDMDTTVLSPARPQNFITTTDDITVELTWDAPNSANMDHAVVYRAVSGAGFGAATDISGELPGAANDAMSFTDTTATPGVWDYWVTAETSADVASLPAGAETETITDNALDVTGSGDFLDVTGAGDGLSVS